MIHEQSNSSPDPSWDRRAWDKLWNTNRDLRSANRLLWFALKVAILVAVAQFGWIWFYKVGAK